MQFLASSQILHVQGPVPAPRDIIPLILVCLVPFAPRPSSTLFSTNTARSTKRISRRTPYLRLPLRRQPSTHLFRKQKLFIHGRPSLCSVIGSSRKHIQMASVANHVERLHKKGGISRFLSRREKSKNRSDKVLSSPVKHTVFTTFPISAS